MSNPYCSKHQDTDNPVFETAAPTTAINLGHNEIFGDHQRSLLFGEMLKRANAVVTHYHSDLYHDAQWLKNFVRGEQSWFWILRPTGTHIGEDRELSVYAARESQAAAYHVTIAQNPRTDVWTATLQLMSEKASQ